MKTEITISDIGTYIECKCIEIRIGFKCVSYTIHRTAMWPCYTTYRMNSLLKLEHA